MVDVWKAVLTWFASNPTPQTDLEWELLAIVEDLRRKHITVKPVSVDGC